MIRGRLCKSANSAQARALKLSRFMSHAMMSKFLAKPFNKLKEASRNGDADYCDVVSDLFGVDGQ